MKFGPRPLSDAIGAYLAHSERLTDGVARKGTRITDRLAGRLADAGVEMPIVALLEPGDVHEDEAAGVLAQALAGKAVRADPPDTGRANLFAEAGGLFVPDKAAVDRLNAVDPAITLATLGPYRRVLPGQMIATVKIIPFAVAGEALARARAVADEEAARLSVHAWQNKTVAAISTTLPTLKASVIDKTLDIFARRLAEPGATIGWQARVAHRVEPLSKALSESEADVVVIFGASAVIDADDVIPAAIRAAGGEVARVGMPVDPGNLLVLGALGHRAVIGAPGCARSPKENGFDFVLDRLLAGVPVRGDDIAAMGVGGLLTDTAARPRPRRGTPSSGPARREAAVVLAAGRSSRMGRFKLTEPVGGVPMVRRVVEAALASRADPVVVVTGHESDRVHDALKGLDVVYAHNANYPEGLSTSLKAGLLALPREVDAALVLLGDMPLVSAADCDKVLAALTQDGVLIATATAGGTRGNPVAWSAQLFPELRATEGDAGGRALMSRYSDQTVGVELGEVARLDADTPEGLDAVRARVG